MTGEIRVIQYGVGTIGLEVVRLILEKDSLQLVGVVDVDPSKVGRDVGELLGIKPAGVKVSNSPKKIFSSVSADVVVHTTVSSLKQAKPQILEILEAGLNVVSTTEELSFPIGENKAIAAELNKAAEKNKVTVIGVGVNPGFVMDALPLFMTSVAQKVEKIEINRQINASNRRVPFQKKIGSTLTVEQFNAKVKEGVIRHVGLPESLSMIAHHLNFKLDEMKQTIEPVVSDREIRLDWGVIKKGHVRGVKQSAVGIASGEEKIILNFMAAIDAKESYDEIKITGVPQINLRIEGGVHGDRATSAIAVNMIPVAVNSTPGLKTMGDILPKLLR